ncbi:MAG: hypothetical protein JWN03_6682 [Nocardia sp.]|nr:hypothetical protein [Nocardia sp.]
MRDNFDNHVTTLDGHGYAADVDNVAVSISVRGSFRVKYFAPLDKVCLDVCRWGEYGDMSTQLTVEQAIALRDLLDAGIADARVAKALGIGTIAAEIVSVTDEVTR